MNRIEAEKARLKAVETLWSSFLAKGIKRSSDVIRKKFFRSLYSPHQGLQEQGRRVRQIAKGMLKKENGVVTT